MSEASFAHILFLWTAQVRSWSWYIPKNLVDSVSSWRTQSTKISGRLDCSCYLKEEFLISYFDWFFGSLGLFIFSNYTYPSEENKKCCVSMVVGLSKQLNGIIWRPARESYWVLYCCSFSSMILPPQFLPRQSCLQTNLFHVIQDLNIIAHSAFSEASNWFQSNGFLLNE